MSIIPKGKAEWKQAIINQSAHFGVGLLVYLFGSALGVPTWSLLLFLFVGAWTREVWQKDWELVAFTRIGKWNDVMWFMLGIIVPYIVWNS